MKFDAPIAELKDALHTAKTNAPINEREGRKGQARLERANIPKFEDAIEVLQRVPHPRKPRLYRSAK